jgi:hypothetical protein
MFHRKRITMYVIPMFVKVLSVAVNYEHRNFTVYLWTGLSNCNLLLTPQNIISIRNLHTKAKETGIPGLELNSSVRMEKHSNAVFMKARYSSHFTVRSL